MPREMSGQSKRRVLLAILVFFISYVVFLLLWIQVKDFYASGITSAASRITAGLTDSRFEQMIRKNDIIELTFSPLQNTRMLIDIPVKTSSYTFNAPLTFAIMAMLYVFLRKRVRAYAEALLILAAVHLLYVVSLETNLLLEVFAEQGIAGTGAPGTAFYQFLSGFTENMVIRFEPFLIGVYMFLKFRSEQIDL
jgi:hypothetical protein